MAYKTTILHAKAGFIVPEPLLHKVMDSGVLSVGFAAAVDGEIQIGKTVKPDLVNMQTLQDGFKEVDYLLICREFERAHDEDDMQPYVIIEDEDKPQLVACIGGDFSNYAKKDSKRADAFHVFDEVILAGIGSILERAESMEDILKALDDAKVKSTLSNLTKTEGGIYLLSASGEVKTFLKGGSEMEWGSSSTLLAEAFPETKAKLKLTLKKMTVASTEPIKPVEQPAGTPPAKETVTEPVIEQPVGILDPRSPLRKQYLEQASKGSLIQSPPTGLSNNKTKGWYGKHFGTIPDAWKDKVPVAVRIPDWQQLAKSLGDPNKRVVKDFRELAAVKKVETQNIPAPQEYPVVGPSTPVLAKDLPLASPNQKRDFLGKYIKSEEVQKIITQGVDVPSTEEIEGYLKKLPSFSEQTGLDVNLLLPLSFEKKLELCREYHEIAAIFMQALCLMILRGMQGQKIGGSTPVTTSVPVTKPKIQLRKAS